MKTHFKILIADRNPHVRGFLKREMSAAGYEVELAETGQDVLKWVFKDCSLDLLILDTDLPDTDDTVILKKLQSRLPSLPVILHTFPFDGIRDTENISVMRVVEKSGSSVEQLKTAAFEILQRGQSGAG